MAARWHLQLATLLCVLACCRGLQTTLLRGEDECVQVHTDTTNGFVSGSAVVYDVHSFFEDEHVAIEVKVRAPDGSIIFHQEGPDVSFDQGIHLSGYYELCLANKHTSMPVIVDFYMEIFEAHHWVPHSVRDDKKEAASQDHLEKISKQVFDIKHDVHSLSVDQRFFHSQLNRQKENAKRTQSRVVQLAIVELVVIVAASFLQVAIVRYMFDLNQSKRSGLSQIPQRRRMAP